VEYLEGKKCPTLSMQSSEQKGIAQSRDLDTSYHSLINHVFPQAHHKNPTSWLDGRNQMGASSNLISMGHNAVGGYVLRDWKGHLLQAGTHNFGRNSILVAEARPLR